MKYFFTIRYLCILLFFLPLAIVQAQEASDCLRFRTGKFRVEGGGPTVITRTKKFQMEENAQIKSRDKVIWLDDCTYQLVPHKIIRDETGQLEHWTLLCEILETGENYYIVRISSKDTNYEVLAKLIKL